MIRMGKSTSLTEKEIYNILGLKYIPPNLRESKGELKKFLRGDIHE